MPGGTDERSRVLGGLVCLGAIVAGALFLFGLTLKSYWALALPLAVLVLFVLGLVLWIGWTIATVQVQPEGDPLASAGGGPGAATVEESGGGDAAASSEEPS